MNSAWFTLALVFLSANVQAQTPQLKSPLSAIGFLVGQWSSGKGKVAETGGTSTGSSTVTIEAGGAVLLRRDHTDLFDASGKPAGAFDQIMMIYPEGGTLHADYSDGTHVIHYVSAQIRAGQSVVFATPVQPGAPTFRLAYELSAPRRLGVSFSMAPPGSLRFRPVATGTLTRAR
jgi:hypothetical protein